MTLSHRDARAAEPSDPGPDYKAAGKRINQSVCAWCFRPMSVEDLAINSAKMGIKSVELVSPKDWPLLKKHGLTCAIAGSTGFKVGPADPKSHDEVKTKITASIDAAAAAGVRSVICFSGMSNGIDKAAGLDNSVKCFKEVISHAEKKKINLCLEMLNTRDDTHPMKGHPGYMADDLGWCKQLCDRVGSERMKILFDIYHVQIMHGDVIRRIRELKDYIGHYHTAGVPGRGEMDDTQELNYAPIMRAIAETGYTGYVGHEFIPTRDPMTGLREAVKLCDV